MQNWYGWRNAEYVLRTYKTFAMVGCSSDPSRPSHRVARFLISRGFIVIPVNPNETEILGRHVHPNLVSIPHRVEVVDLFRRPAQVSLHVDEAIAIGAKAVWMQLGIADEVAARRAEDAGLAVVMNRCPAIDYPRFVETGRRPD